MKITQTLLILSILLLSFNYSQTVEWLSETNHDFGLIEPNEPVTVEFQYKNISSESLLIDNIRTTCGCTTPEWNYDEEILPGAVSIIKLEYDAKKIGTFEKKAKVFFKGIKKPERLVIAGEVME